MINSSENPPKASPRKKAKVKVETFPCSFCKKEFLSEKVFFGHMCEQKRRYVQRDEKHVKMAFSAYCTFFKRRMGQKKEPTYESFAKSNMYMAFLRFAIHLKNIEAINPLGYIDFLIKLEVGIDDWTHDKYYQRYIRELTKTEEPLEAMERNFLLMERWAVSTGEKWTDFFRKVAPAQATLWIQAGRLSPWILLTAESAAELMNRLSQEQVKIVNDLIDVAYWEIKINRRIDEVEHIQQVLKEVGL